MFTKSMPEHFEKPVAMHGLLGAHLLEHLRSTRVGIAQGIGEFAVDAAILLFVGDGEGQDLSFRQILEFLEHNGLIPVSLERELHKSWLEVTRHAPVCKNFIGDPDCPDGTFVLLSI